VPSKPDGIAALISDGHRNVKSVLACRKKPVRMDPKIRLGNPQKAGWYGPKNLSWHAAKSRFVWTQKSVLGSRKRPVDTDPKICLGMSQKGRLVPTKKSVSACRKRPFGTGPKICLGMPQKGRLVRTQKSVFNHGIHLGGCRAKFVDRPSTLLGGVICLSKSQFVPTSP
jgi:hypothetical protein